MAVNLVVSIVLPILLLRFFVPIFIGMNQVEKHLSKSVSKGDFKSLARIITIVENELKGYEELLLNLQPAQTPVIGITGPPGSGKSSLLNSIVKILIQQQKRVAVVAIDPTSPFNYGSLLGDRVRMPELFNLPNVFIRSVATRGSLGGLSEKIIEITDVLRTAGFDFIFVETVGVGQSEVEIAGLADVTIVVFVPESGDEIQTMKSGVMEIADIFIVNKSDHEGADSFAENLRKRVGEGQTFPPVLKTSAILNEGIQEVISEVEKVLSTAKISEKKIYLLTEKAFRLIQRERMNNVSKQKLMDELRNEMNKIDFNLYRFIKQQRMI
jgi:LAO/AO transport system kinase